jgi:hypothetical protein
MTALVVALIALFFALLTVADLLPSALERRSGLTVPGR